jgi:predicted TPR repeat methyltransferase
MLQKEKNNLENFYDQMSNKYESICKGDHYKVPLWLKKNLSLIPKEYYPRWLDIGCGSGIVGDLIKELKIETVPLFC